MEQKQHEEQKKKKKNMMMMNNTSHGKQMAQYVHPYNPIPTIHNFPSSDFTNYPYNRRHCTIPTNSYCCLKLFLLWSRSTQLPYGVNPLWLRWKGLYEVNLKYGCLDETFLDYIYFFICIWWTNVVMDKFVTNVVMVTNVHISIIQIRWLWLSLTRRYKDST